MVTGAKSSSVKLEHEETEFVSQSAYVGSDVLRSSAPQDEQGDETTWDPLRSDGIEEINDLKHFLSRPVKLWEQAWTEGDALRVTEMYPWHAYLRDTVIARKIANYSWISGTLHIKAMINASPFHYGRALLCWRPLKGDGTEFIRSPGNAPFVDNIRFSQRLKVELNPTENMGGEMTIPFVWDKSFLDIGSDNDLKNIGELILSSYQTLDNAQGVSGRQVNITITAWLSDVKLSGPTNFVSQSLNKVNEQDEYEENNKGLISTPASAVAKAAGALTDIPLIGKYATATQLAASGISKVARAFGYSQPASLESRRYYKSKPIGELSVAAGTALVDKLALDPKQELSIDPAICGSTPSEDEMSIANICARESYICKAKWTYSDLPEKALFRSLVTPSQFVRERVSTTDYYHMTPMGHLSQLFQYWRGTMEYKFVVACSKYHKGRLRVVYDPHADAAGATYPAWAGPMTKIIDLSEQTEFTVKIGMNQDVPFLNVDTISGTSNWGNTTPTDSTGTTVETLNPENGRHNGMLSIYVMNQLSSPTEADGGIYINTFIRMHDAEFGQMNGKALELTAQTDGWYRPNAVVRSSPFVSQSALVDPDPLDVDPEPATDLGTYVETVDTDTDMLTYFGEAITSLRSVLKRPAVYKESFPLGPTNETMYFEKPRFTQFPLYSGVDNSIALTQPRRTTFLTYLTPAFAARRGAVRWKVIMQQPPVVYDNTTGGFSHGREPINSLWAHIIPGKSNLNSDEGFTYPVTAITDTALLNLIPNTGHGASHSLEAQMPTLEIEVPFYTNKRFAYGQDTQASNNEELGGRQWLACYHHYNLTGTQPTSLVTLCSAGEDFSLSHYVNAPVMISAPKS